MHHIQLELGLTLEKVFYRILHQNYFFVSAFGGGGVILGSLNPCFSARYNKMAAFNLKIMLGEMEPGPTVKGKAEAIIQMWMFALGVSKLPL